MWSREELETVVVIEPPEKRAHIYSNYQSTINHLRKYAEEYPEVTLERDEGDAIEIIVPDSWVKIKPPRKLSEEQRLKSAQRLEEWRKKNKAEKE